MVLHVIHVLYFGIDIHFFNSNALYKAMPCTEYNIDFLQCRFILINEIILSYFSVHLLSILKRGIGHSISSLMSAVLPD